MTEVFVNCGDKSGQMKIQQMAFMIVAVFIFFALVGLAFLGFQLKDVKSNAQSLEREGTISSLSVIADMPELNCDSNDFMCLDKSKLLIMGSSKFREMYNEFWPVVSIEVKKIHPFDEQNVECSISNPDTCNHYTIYNSDSTNGFEKYSTYVSICEQKSSYGTNCELGKLIVGVKLK
jgi:hypothetical protein